MCKQSSREIPRTNNYIINHNRDETIPYTTITTRHNTNKTPKIHKFTNYILYEYIMYSKCCNHTSYTYTTPIASININVLTRLIDEYNQCFAFMYTDKTGEIHILCRHIKSQNKLNTTFHLIVNSMNKPEPNISISCDTIINVRRIRDATRLISLTDSKNHWVVHADYEPRRIN